MQFWTALVLAALGASSAVVSASKDMQCTNWQTRPLRWHMQDSHVRGNLSFSYLKDNNGRPIATTRESDNSPAKAVKFTFAACAAPKGGDDYMGYGSGRQSNGGAFGQIKLASDESQCLTASGLHGKGMYFVLDKCVKEDSKALLYQFFAYPVNGISLGFLGHTKSQKGGNYHQYIEGVKGAPFQFNYIGQSEPPEKGSAFINWLHWGYDDNDA